MTDRRLIEVAFPLKQASLDSVHEKNVRHGHISTLHIWPARRQLAACRAALDRDAVAGSRRAGRRNAKSGQVLGGQVVGESRKKKGPGAKGEEKVVEETVGGVLHWGRERENKADLELFRREIHKAFDGRARGCSIRCRRRRHPLEAMRWGVKSPRGTSTRSRGSS